VKRKILLFSVAVMVVIGLLGVGCAPQAAPPEEATYEWTFGQCFPEGTIRYDFAEDLVKRVDEASNGRIILNHYPGDLLGDWAVQAENVMRGTQDVYVGAVPSSVTPKWEVHSLVYIVGDWDHAYEFYKPGGWLYGVFQKIAEEDSNWKVLGIAPEGFAGIVSTKEFAPMPGPKNLKARVMGAEGWRLMMEAIGFDAVTMPWSEIHSALMLGTIDAAMGATGADDYDMFSDVADYAYFYNAAFGTNLLIVNLDLFNSLSPADQELLEKVGSEWTAYTWSVYKDYQDEKWDEIRAAGKIEIIELTPEQWSANAEVVRAAAWPYYEEVVGKDIMDVIEANAA